MSPDTPSARELAHRLLARDAARGGDVGGVALVVAACERAHLDLARWIGPAGCHALFTRALTQARIAHPALRHVDLRVGAAPGLDHVDQAVAASSADAVAAGLEEMLVALLSLLGRLIGDDMMERLLEPGVPVRATDARPDDSGAR